MTDFTDTRVSEKKFYSIPDTLLTADGTADGLITIPSTYPYKVGMVISLSSTTLQPRRLKIKRVISETQMYIGEEKTKINEYADLSIFLLADAATITYLEQQRPVIDILEIQRQVYEEEPTVALRNHSVDWLGRPYDKTNPLPVQLSDGSINIGTVNAELEVQLSHLDNDPDAGDVHDSIRIGDGVETLEINPDGSINVNLVQSPPNQEQSTNTYGEALGVTSGSETLIVSFTASSASKRYSLQRAEFTGEQIGLYRLYINGTNIATKRTHHGSGLSGGYEFIGGSQEGLFLSTGDVVELKVLHTRPSTGDFEGRIQIFEVSNTTSYEWVLLEDGFSLLAENGDNIGLEV
jgi:hypothetical protein